MNELIIRNARLAGQPELQDLWLQDERIIEIGVGIFDARPNTPAIDAQGNLVSAPFVDPHFHMDATLSYGLPRVNESGTLLEGIALWGELKPHLTQEAIIERALSYCDWAVAKGLLAIRSHVDICDERLLAVEALLEVREKVRPYLDLQLVAFPQDGLLRSPGAQDHLKRALDMGVDVIGGIPHFERTMADGAQSIRLLTQLAADRGLRIDMHCDESDDPMSRHIETLAQQTRELGLGSRVTASHLTSMHSMDNYYVSKLIPLMVEASLQVVSNPLINMTIQGRHDTYPKRRGLTRVPELLAAGVNVAFGHDCVMDPWYSMGSADMLEVAAMGLHACQMTSRAQMQQCFEAVTTNGASVMGLEDYGVDVGCRANLVVLQASDPIEAIRLRSPRLFVIRAGQVVSQTAPAQANLSLPGRPGQTNWMAKPEQV
ncbi:MAG: amidohydrolase family protein [Burkholderiaceae bacterium]